MSVFKVALLATLYPMTRSRNAVVMTLALALAACTRFPRAVEPVQYIAGIPHPEDLVRLPGTRWALVSGMRDAQHAGRIYAFDLAGRNVATPVYPAVVVPTFAPHGIATRRLSADSFELLAVNHGAGEAINRLRVAVNGDRVRAVLVDSIPLPAGAWANGVAPMPDGGFVVTSMYDPRDRAFIARFARAGADGRRSSLVTIRRLDLAGGPALIRCERHRGRCRKRIRFRVGRTAGMALLARGRRAAVRFR